MSSQGRGTDLFGAAGTAGLEIMRAVSGDAALAVLFWGVPPEVEVIHHRGIPIEVCLSLSSAGGRYLAEAVRRSGVPLHVETAALPPEAERLTVALGAGGIGSLAVFPLFGERRVVGCIVVPVGGDFDAERIEGAGWQVACRVLMALQLASGAAVARFLLSGGPQHRLPSFDGVVVADAWERVLFADGLALESSGWSDNDPFGRSLDRLPGGPQLWDVGRSAPGSLIWTSLDLPLSDDAPMPVDVAAVETSLLGDGRGGVHLLFIRDARPEGLPPGARIDRVLALASRLAHAADELLASVRDVPLDMGAKSLLGELFRGAKEVPAVVRSLAESAAPAGRLGTVDLNEVLTSLVERVRAELEVERIRIFSFLDPELGIVPGDGFEVARALRVVLARARSSLRSGGGTLTIRTWREDGWVCAAVSDDGAGTVAVSPFVSSFEPLFDPSPELPDEMLRKVQSAVERSGGRFQMESRPRLWNRCTLMLPADAPVEEDASLAADRIRVGRDSDGHLEVLVVDDNPALRSVLRRYLERRGHVVTEAVDGEQALNMVTGRPFDRLIVDIQMPGKSGPEFYGCLEDVAPELRARTFFMTGGVLQEAVERFLDESGRPSIPKPFDLGELARTLEAGV